MVDFAAWKGIAATVIFISMLLPFVIYFVQKKWGANRWDRGELGLIVMDYLGALYEKRQQLIFLGSALTFYVSILSIVFGVSSNIIDEYLRTDGVDSYEFRKVSDVLKFPVEQSLLLNSSATSKVPSYTKFDPQLNDVKNEIEYRIVDASVVDFDKRVISSIRTKLIEIGTDISPQTYDDELGFLFLELIYRQLFRSIVKKAGQDYSLHYMLPICPGKDNGSKITIPSKVGKNETGTDCLDMLKMECEDEKIWPTNCLKGDTESRFDLLFKEVQKWVKGSKRNESTLITIMSDFNAENQEVLNKTRLALQALSSLNNPIRFNLIRFDARKNASNNSDALIGYVKKYFPESHVLDFRVDNNKEPIPSTQLLLPYAKEDLYIDKLSMASRMIRMQNETKAHYEGRLKKPIEPGHWGFRVLDFDESKELEISINNEVKSLNGSFVNFDVLDSTQALTITYQGDNYYDFAGNLEVFNAEYLSLKKYNLWQRRVLNETTIGFISIGIVSIIIILLIGFYVLVREIDFITILSIDKLSIFLTNKTISFYYILITIIGLCLGSTSLWEFLLHAFSSNQLKYPQPYIGILVVMLIFSAIRIYKKSTPNWVR